MPPDTSHPTCPHGRNIRMCTDCQDRIIPPKVPIPRQPRALPSRASAEEPSSTKVQAKRGPPQQGHTEGDDLNMPPAKRSRKRRQNENGETAKNIKKEVWKYIDFTLSNLEKAKIPFTCAVQVDTQILDHRQVARGRREFGLNQMERNQYRYKNMCMICTPISKIGTNKEECSQRRSKAATDTRPSMLDQWSSSVPLPKTIANSPYSMFDESAVPIAKPIIEDTKLALPLLPKQWTELPVSSRPAPAVIDRLKESVVELSDSAFESPAFLAKPTIPISMPSSADDKKSESKDTDYDSHGTPDWIDWSQTASSHTIPPNRGQVNTHPIVHAPHNYNWGFSQGSPQSFRLPFIKSTSVFDDAMNSLSQSVAGMNMGVQSWK
ncbi:hypothetical protein KCU81_g8240, partial [Aureobasidium melanogenum]|uniref:Uncharacterized protein n=1 Tax=Aureobasidium melanogenum (strain CBS 110374) TaxID=1043003 RepID=A0A074WQ68_AURM1